MALVVDLGITAIAGGVKRIEVLEIRRLEALENPSYPFEETHRYKATRYENRDGELLPLAQAELDHVYGYGAWVLVRKAMDALGLGAE